MLHDGHGRRVQIDSLGIIAVGFPDDGTVLRGKVVDGIAVCVAVGKSACQHILQMAHQPRYAEARSGVIDAVGVWIGDEGTVIDLYLMPAGDRSRVQATVEGAALDRDGAGFVGNFDAVEFFFAVGELALDRDSVVYGERTAGRRERSGIIHSVDRAAACNGERSGPHVNDRHRVIIRIADVGMGNGVSVQVQRNIDVV